MNLEIGNEKIQCTKSPIEHILNNHKRYDLSWCFDLQARRSNKNYRPLFGHEFYKKKSHTNCQLCDCVSRFQTQEGFLKNCDIQTKVKSTKY